ncbi:MAG: endonuclease III [Pseudomonadota bacterium]
MPNNIKTILTRFQQRNPNPKLELYYTNHFTLLIAILMSARMTDKGVNKVTQCLFDQIKTPQDVIEMGIDKLTDALKTIGLYKTKAKHIVLLSEILVRQYQGQTPTTHEELTALPGVGRKTANVFLNETTHAATLGVDTHVFRVSHRLGLSTGKTPEAVEKDLLAIIPQEYFPMAPHWFVLHGRYICKSQNPKCSSCFLNDICPYYQNLNTQMCG